MPRYTNAIVILNDMEKTLEHHHYGIRINNYQYWKVEGRKRLYLLRTQEYRSKRDIKESLLTNTSVGLGIRPMFRVLRWVDKKEL